MPGLFQKRKEKEEEEEEENKKRERSDDIETEVSLRCQGRTSSEGIPADVEAEIVIRDSGKRQKSGSNDCRSHKESWKERLQYDVIDRDLAGGCSCDLKCVSKLQLGRVFECRAQNSNRSSAELSSHCLLKLDHGFNRDLETMSYTTAHGSPCCRRGFEVEQGFRKPYVTEKLKKIRKGETQDADRGGKSFLTLYEHLETRLLLCLRLYLHFRYTGWWRAWC